MAELRALCLVSRVEGGEKGCVLGVSLRARVRMRYGVDCEWVVWPLLSRIYAFVR